MSTCTRKKRIKYSQNAPESVIMKGMNPVFALVLAHIIWGAAPPIFKFSLEGIPPFTLAFIRFFFAGLIFIPFILKNKQKISWRDWKDILIGAFFGVTLNVGFFFLGLQYAPSINMHVIGSLGPIILYFLSLYWLKEKPHEQIVHGMLISLIGVLVIIFAPLLAQGFAITNTTATNLHLIGNIFFLGAVLSTVFHTVIYKRVLKKINSYTVTGYGFLFSSLLFSPLMFWELQTWSFAQLTVSGFIGIFYGVFFASALAYFMYNFGVSRMHAQEVGVFSYISPIVAVIVAIPVVQEYPDIYFLLGAILVFAGIYISERKMKKHAVHNLQKET